MKIFSKLLGGRSHYNEGQVLVEFIYFLIIIFGILYCFSKPEFNFVEKFKTKVEELHDKRNEEIKRIREREPSSSYHRSVT